ncbi:MAG: transketolase [Limosilactobacillus pontis]|uniref:Transketolase n=1 Tax=Limosilactobacillus pontis TaxID=35787 RepID=A0A2J6NLX7_9LACO|nr:transketolase [Limosilactobacillus pontis]PMB82327.1 transketolase [Limosilactobacillus pontis]
MITSRNTSVMWTPAPQFTDQDQQAVDALRFMSMDMIERAQSGHPGSPMGMAPMAYTLWEKFLSFNPNDPQWLNRDRFVLSGGHCSALLYSLLHFNGFDLSLDDIKHFRQLGSRTPGHPEYRLTPGVDASTGPLGQGFAMAVGMAMAERHLALQYNKPGYPVIDHYTYSIVGDGDLMEGISDEAMSLAGKNRLGRLIVLYDSNDVSLDGPLSLSNNENTGERFKAAHWDYQLVEDGGDMNAIARAISRAQKSSQPSLIEVKTIIGYNSPDEGTNKVHGNPLGKDNLAVTRENYQWPYPPFEYPDGVYQQFAQYVMGKKERYNEWQALFSDYQREFPNQAKQLGSQRLDIRDLTNHYQPGDRVSTRIANSVAMQDLAKRNPQLWGGSADLFSSNKTRLKDYDAFKPANYGGRNIYFGVREFGMAAAINGINLHGGSRAYCSTFMVFSDYLKPAIRLAALQKLPSIFILTHDSLMVGEDGPTHEPVEQLAMLRTIPNVQVFRPADANELVAVWQTIAKTTDRPSVIIASRQDLPVLNETVGAVCERGAYVVADTHKPQGIIMASGSELSLALAARERLAKQHDIHVRVVSMVSMERFNQQSAAYREQILPNQVRTRLAVEMASPAMWGQYVGLDGDVIGVEQFGQSGDGQTIANQYGFTVDNVVKHFLALKQKGASK